MLRLVVVGHPGARAERVALLGPTEVGVWVRARPVEGQANLAIQRALATALGLRPAQVRLLSGRAARRKIVEVDLPGPEVLAERLVAHAVRSTGPGDER